MMPEVVESMPPLPQILHIPHCAVANLRSTSPLPQPATSRMASAPSSHDDDQLLEPLYNLEIPPANIDEKLLAVIEDVIPCSHQKLLSEDEIYKLGTTMCKDYARTLQYFTRDAKCMLKRRNLSTSGSKLACHRRILTWHYCFFRRQHGYPQQHQPVATGGCAPTRTISLAPPLATAPSTTTTTTPSILDGSRSNPVATVPRQPTPSDPPVPFEASEPKPLIQPQNTTAAAAPDDAVVTATADAADETMADAAVTATAAVTPAAAGTAVVVPHQEDPSVPVSSTSVKKRRLSDTGTATEVATATPVTEAPTPVVTTSTVTALEAGGPPQPSQLTARLYDSSTQEIISLLGEMDPEAAHQKIQSLESIYQMRRSAVVDGIQSLETLYKMRRAAFDEIERLEDLLDNSHTPTAKQERCRKRKAVEEQSLQSINLQISKLEQRSL